MDIRVLRYFLAVAREENITRAAESLHISQPSLSKQLMELEDQLGKELLIRGKRKVTLTEDGVLLRKRADEILTLVAKTEQEISSDSSDITGDLYLGGNTPDIILRAASQLRSHHPDIQFHFHSADAVDITERLDHGSLDFAVMLEPVDTVKYNYLSLPAYSEWGILMKCNDPLAELDAIPRNIVTDIPLILHQRLELQQELAHWAEVDLEQLRIAATYNIVHGSPIPFVNHGLGYFLTTRELIAPAISDDVCFRPLDPPLPLTYALVWKKHAVFSRVAVAFYEQVKEELSFNQQ